MGLRRCEKDIDIIKTHTLRGTDIVVKHHSSLIVFSLNLFPVWSSLVLHFPLCCGKWLCSFQANEHHLSQQHILQRRDKEITKIFTSQRCLPSRGTCRDISILVSSYSFLKPCWITKQH